jgi:hypothetical protein
VTNGNNPNIVMTMMLPRSKCCSSKILAKQALAVFSIPFLDQIGGVRTHPTASECSIASMSTLLAPSSSK